jgi:predicted DNA-binding protein
MVDHRITIRLSDEDHARLSDLRALLGVGTDSAAIRRSIHHVYNALDQAGATRALRRLRDATSDDRQLSLLDLPSKPKKVTSRKKASRKKASRKKATSRKKA